MEPSVLFQQCDNVKLHYQQLNYAYQEGLIPPELYLKELKLVREYLEGLNNELSIVSKQIEEQQ